MNSKSVIISALGILMLGSQVQAAEADGAKPVIQWAGCGISKKAFMSEMAKAYEKKTGIKIKLSGGGATKGIRKAAAGEIDIGGACRVALESHKAERYAHQIPVAWDALVVIAHKDNPVKNIKFDQIRGIYLGKIKNWKELGGNDAPIELYVRRGKMSGVGRTLRELVFANFDQEFKRATYVVKSSGPVEKGVLKNINGIGITGISSAKRRDVQMLSLDGKAPTYDNIKNGNKDKKVRDFIRYATSREGQAVIRKAGTVPYSEAMVLVMKQLDQYQRASSLGLYRTSTTN